MFGNLFKWKWHLYHSKRNAIFSSCLSTPRRVHSSIECEINAMLPLNNSRDTCDSIKAVSLVDPKVAENTLSRLKGGWLWMLHTSSNIYTFSPSLYWNTRPSRLSLNQPHFSRLNTFLATFASSSVCFIDFLIVECFCNVWTVYLFVMFMNTVRWYSAVNILIRQVE